MTITRPVVITTEVAKAVFEVSVKPGGLKLPIILTKPILKAMTLAMLATVTEQTFSLLTSPRSFKYLLLRQMNAYLPPLACLPQADVTGSPVTALPFREQVATILGWAAQRESRFVCVANVHMLMESRWDETFRTILKMADMVTPDGMPLVWMMRALGIKEQDRVAGIDIFMETCKQAEQQAISIYLLGSTEDVLAKMKVQLQAHFPNLKLAGIESPPFRPLTPEEDAELVERINASGAGITFVSLGCPKQERWMAEHRGRIQSVMLGVGAVFPVYAGIKKHAPKWVRELGLEWLYRLVQEPGRLWKRYATTIPPFLWLALQQITSHYGYGSSQRFRF